MENPELVLDAKAALGEGAVWVADRQRLYWVDIMGKTVHIYNPASGAGNVLRLRWTKPG